jgi:hypothetical protein
MSSRRKRKRKDSGATVSATKSSDRKRSTQIRLETDAERMSVAEFNRRAARRAAAAGREIGKQKELLAMGEARPKSVRTISGGGFETNRSRH